MGDDTESNLAASQRRARWRTTAIAVVLSFAVGFRIGSARQERRLLEEFLINAARAGILDYERLSELAGDVDANRDPSSTRSKP